MKILDNIVRYVGEKAALLNLFLIIFIGIDVILRYVLNNTKNWVLELEWHLFSLIFLFGIPYALQKNEHVRVDVFYHRFSLKTQRWIDTIGHILLLTPWTLVVIYTSYKYASNSFYFSESSPNPGGLPYRYIIKFCIVIGFVLLLMQGWSIAIQNIKAQKSKI